MPEQPTPADLAVDLAAELEGRFWHGIALASEVAGRVLKWRRVPLAALRRAVAAETALADALTENQRLRDELRQVSFELSELQRPDCG